MPLLEQVKLRSGVLIVLVVTLFALVLLLARPTPLQDPDSRENAPSPSRVGETVHPSPSPSATSLPPEEPSNSQCEWTKDVWVSGAYVGEAEDGPFPVLRDDTVIIEDTLWCAFEYEWSLWETWDPSVLELVDSSVSISQGEWYGDVEAGLLEWYGDHVSADSQVQLTKTYLVVAQGWDTTSIFELIDFGPLSWEMPLVLRENGGSSLCLPMVARDL
jgi:hypothetical protein